MALHLDKPCPFELGCRVAHRRYGTGTVTSSPDAVQTVSASTRQLKPDGWRMEVSWDDERRAPGRMRSGFLTRLSLNYNHSASFLAEDQSSFLDDWKNALKAVDDYASASRSTRNAATLNTLQIQEDATWRSMRHHFSRQGIV
jgi:hypothetical protein